MKKFLITTVILLTSLGCSRPYWLAKISVVKAEEAYSKAHALRMNKKVAEEVRLKYYGVACSNFLKAYRYDPSVFTLYRIELAADACLRVEDFESAKLFREFGEAYAKKHPKEVKYGDVGPWMTLDG